jgi:tetratricopeptide (TPR) repeat protein
MYHLILRVTALMAVALLTWFPARTQTARAFEKAAEKEWKQENWGAALYYLKEAWTIQPDNPRIIYKLADVARKYSSLELAEDRFAEIVARSEWLKEYPEAEYLLAEVLRGQGSYEEATRHFQQFLEKESVGDSLLLKAKEKAAACQWAEKARRDSLPAELVHLDKKVNSDYSDFAPFPSGDSLFFSSYRFDFKSDEHIPPRRLTKVLLAKGRSKARAIPRGINSSSSHAAHLVFSPDRKKIFFNRCSFIGSVKIECELCERRRTSGKKYGRYRRLPRNINLSGYTQTQPTVQWDSVNQRQILYFVSDRPGGLGGFDIWYTYQIDDRSWAEPENFTAANTSGNEVSPFFDQERQRMYFSSDGYAEKSFGGYDIYQLSLRNGQWDKKPLPLPAPMNSSYNDLYYTLKRDSSEAFFSSNRPGSFFLDPENKTCCNDIYKVIFPQPEEPDMPEPPQEITLVEEEPEPEPEKVYEVLEDFLPLALYFHNDEPDRRSRKQTTKKPYLETFDAYYDLKEEYLESFTQGMASEQAEAAEYEIETFFQEEVKKGGDLLVKFSNLLLERLEEGEEIEIFLKGFTSPRAQSQYNFNLAKRRISSVRNHFLTYANGVFKPYLDSKQLIISERSFGETQASMEISDELEDLRNSIYSVPASLERRVEIMEIIRD